jgi:hypothetical protein
MVTCINGGFNNFSHFEVAALAGAVKPRATIPAQYHMFPDNSVDPRQFQASLTLKAPHVAYLELLHN